MKKILLAFMLTGMSYLSVAQAPDDPEKFKVKLKSGSYVPEEKLSLSKKTRKAASAKSYVLIQFYDLPSKADHEKIKEAGIQLFNYIPNNAYWASIPEGISETTLKSLNVRSVEPIKTEQKIDNSLKDGSIPKHAEKVAGKVDLKITYFTSDLSSNVKNNITSIGGQILKESPDQNQFVIRIDKDLIPSIATIEGVSSISPVSPAPTTDNFPGVNASRVNVLRSGISTSRNLKGDGMSIAIGDVFTGNIHPDQQNRINNYASSSTELHGDHTSGTLAGTGNLNPLYTGIAPKANLVYTNMTDDVVSAPYYYTNNNVKITSNSYGSYGAGGVYNDDSRTVDLQLTNTNYPDLLHVFSSGNFGPSFRTARGGFQAAKNSLVVGNISYDNQISSTSSIGPVADGRIKPEVVAIGENVISTFPENQYSLLSGTSMSTPCVTGATALLYERYKQLNSNTTPNSALIKALLCNSADDLGNSGPDFTFGFGLINLKKAVEDLEDTNYFQSSVNAGDSVTHAITVPSGSAKLKVLLYWKDPAASVTATVSLVNNLNLRVKNSSTVYLPWILNPAIGQENNLAIRGVDNLNNIEQVTIDNPNGVYNFTVSGKFLTSGSQDYVVTYEILQPSITVTYPYYGESMVPGELVTLRWDEESAPGPISLSYSSDNGSTWTSIATGIPSGQKYYDWTVPNLTTAGLKIRVSNGSITGVSAGASYVIGVPQNVVVNAPTSTQRQLSWQAVTGASSYDVFQLSPADKEMQLIGNTTNTNYLFQNISSSNFWFSVRAKSTSGAIGRRAIALKSAPYRIAENPAGAVSGINYQYYEGTWPSMPDFGTLTPIKTGTINNFDFFSIRNRADNYGIRFTGYVNIPADGLYSFYVIASTTGKLTIGNDLIIQHSYPQDGDILYNSIALKAGKHAFTFDYLDYNASNEFAVVQIAGPGLSRKVIEDGDLFRVTGSKPLTNITSPLNNSTYSTSSLTINAAASDSDGSISKVEFYEGSNKLGEDLNAPFSFNWTSIIDGTYTIRAKAYDNTGLTSISIPVTITVNTSNTPPTVSIITPLTGTHYTAPASISISASTSDSEGPISKVEFYQNGVKLGEDSNYPTFDWTWTNVPAGTYKLTAKAFDGGGLTKVSDTVIVIVDPTSNSAPVVSVTSPINNASFTAPASIAITASASDSDGSISKVEFYQGTTKLGEALTSPYSYSWTNVAAGTYSITAKAFDNANASTTSSAISIIVNAAPTGDLIGPDCSTSGQTFVLEVNPSLRTGAMTYNWWANTSVQSITPVSGQPYKATVILTSSFTGGQLCAGVNYSGAPYYQQLCKTINVCSSPREGTLETSSSTVILPNPSDFSFSIKSDKVISSMSMFNNLGQEVYSQSHLSEIDIQDFGQELSFGVYTLFVNYTDGSKETIKLVKTK